MKTTLNFDDQLIMKAKQIAIKRGETLTKVIETALRAYISPQQKQKPFKLKLHIIKKGKFLYPEAINDRDRLYDLMDNKE